MPLQSLCLPGTIFSGSILRVCEAGSRDASTPPSFPSWSCTGMGSRRRQPLANAHHWPKAVGSEQVRRHGSKRNAVGVRREQPTAITLISSDGLPVYERGVASEVILVRLVLGDHLLVIAVDADEQSNTDQHAD